MTREIKDSSDAYYSNLWDTTEFVEAKIKEIKRNCDNILKRKERYVAASNLTQVPWEVIGLLHMRESDFDFTCNLCNGEPLNQVTKTTPKGKGPYNTWEESAVDVFEFMSWAMPKNRIWNIVNSLRFMEKYNGMGYANRGKNSAYLWAMSNHGVGSGKFMMDGVYNESFVDGQCGTATALKYLYSNNLSNNY